MKNLLPTALIVAASALSATRADDAAPKGDLAKFQGEWTAKVGPEKDIPVVLTFKGNASTFKITLKNGQDYEATGEIKLGEDAKPYKTIDWVKFVGANGQETPDNLGLYEFVDEKTLKVCNGGPGNERPTEFKAGEGGPPQLFVLTRAK